MASYHLSIKSGKKGTAVEHAAYIARKGKYGKSQKREDLLALEHGNLPAWANDDPDYFWRMADKFERENGAAYREFVLALPIELTLEQNQNLIADFIKREIGCKPFQMAIHAPMAALEDTVQPHLHAMVSDRIPDEIPRPAEQHFRRYNSKHPERGGCKKDSGGKDRATIREELTARRARWAAQQNHYLEKFGFAARVDHRSNRERGINKAAERHLGSDAIKRLNDSDREKILKVRMRE